MKGSFCHAARGKKNKRNPKQIKTQTRLFPFPPLRNSEGRGASLTEGLTVSKGLFYK